MSTRNMRSWFDVVTNTVIISVLSYFAYAVWDTRQHAQVSAPAPDFARLATLVRGTHPQAGRTAVLVIGQDCRACSADAPFDRVLTEIGNRSSGRLSVVVVLPEKGSDPVEFLRMYGLGNSRVVRVDLRKYGIGRTPLLMITDAKGKIQKIWVGQLREDQQTSVLKPAEG